MKYRTIKKLNNWLKENGFEVTRKNGNQFLFDCGIKHTSIIVHNFINEYLQTQGKNPTIEIIDIIGALEGTNIIVSDETTLNCICIPPRSEYAFA